MPVVHQLPPLRLKIKSLLRQLKHPSLKKRLPPQPTISPSPTTDPDKLSSCQTAATPVEYFNGLSCLPNDETAWSNYQRLGLRDTELLLENFLNAAKFTDPIKQQLYQTCTQATSKVVFEDCNQSLRDHYQDLRQAILNSPNFQNRLNECYTKVDAGENLTKEHIREFFWRQVMRDHMLQIYNHCYQTQSVKGYRFWDGHGKLLASSH